MLYKHLIVFSEDCSIQLCTNPDENRRPNDITDIIKTFHTQTRNEAYIQLSLLYQDACFFNIDLSIYPTTNANSGAFLGIC